MLKLESSFTFEFVFFLTGRSYFILS